MVFVCHGSWWTVPPPPVLWDEAGGALGELRTMEGDCAQDLSLSLFIIHHPVHWIIGLPPDLWTHTCTLCSKRCQRKPLGSVWSVWQTYVLFTKGSNTVPVSQSPHTYKHKNIKLSTPKIYNNKKIRTQIKHCNNQFCRWQSVGQCLCGGLREKRPYRGNVLRW